ncbi:MAG: hydroxysqualene dehydroxylase HpnE [Oxalobacteraceae bacterium]|nr:hydroxysqualene dehydroxylase HpnE [Oxalobacteraceae bacterium]
MKSTAQKNVAVIGAGWAGCAAAVKLTQLGHRVRLYEAARTLGGRARRVEMDGRTIDNGQHILLGAYGETLQLMRSIGISEREHLLRLPLQMRYPPATGGMDFIAPRLPAPWHVLLGLWRATGLARQDKLALARFTSAARWMGWRLDTDCSVAELLQRFDQTPRLCRLMWQPLCIAALNTPPERASAQVFLHVLRDSLGARRAASDMLIPRSDLSTLLPQQAAAYLAARGGSVHAGCAITGLRQTANGWQLLTDCANTANAVADFDAVIVATPPERASKLLAGLDADAGIQDLHAQLNGFTYEAITTCYLQYHKDFKLALPFMALQDDPATDSWGQFVFDRGQLNRQHAGLLSVVISVPGAALASGRAVLASQVGRQLARAFKVAALSEPLWSTVITEKRATFCCRPALSRPDNRTALPGLLLAGDYTAGDYPATLESAVRSGLRAASLLQ